MMLKPEELRNEEFEVSVLGGYKREAVDVFFKTVADDYEKLYSENAELVQKLKVCVSKIEEYRKDEQFLKTAIINAEKLNENTLRDIENREKEAERTAKETAENILSRAKTEAENIVKRARLDSEESIRAYEINADRKINEIKRSVQAEEHKLELMKKEVSDFKDTLFKIYKQHLSSISKLPSLAKEAMTEQDEKKEHDTEPEQPTEIKESPVKANNETSVSTENQASDVNPSTVNHEDADKIPVFAGNMANNEKTAEFVIEKKQKQNEDSRLHEMFDNRFKFKDLKFGTDFDLNKDE